MLAANGDPDGRFPLGPVHLWIHPDDKRQLWGASHFGKGIAEPLLCFRERVHLIAHEAFELSDLPSKVVKQCGALLPHLAYRLLQRIRVGKPSGLDRCERRLQRPEDRDIYRLAGFRNQALDRPLEVVDVIVDTCSGYRSSPNSPALAGIADSGRNVALSFVRRASQAVPGGSKCTRSTSHDRLRQSVRNALIM